MIESDKKNPYPYKSFPFNLTRRLVGELSHLINLQIVGKEYVEGLKGNAAIYAFFPHTGHLDGWITYVTLQNLGVKNIVALAAKDYFFDKDSKAFATQLVTPVYPLPRPEKTKSTEDANDIGTSLQQLRQLLMKPGEHWSVVLAPEGTRSNKKFSDRKLKAGVAELALTTGAPIVPVVIKGSENFWPRDMFLPKFLDDFPRRKKISLEFGMPLIFDRVEKSDTRMRHEVLAQLKARYAQMYLPQ